MYIFNTSLFHYIEQVQPSKRGEKELQDAMQMVMNVTPKTYGINILPHSIGIPEDGAYHLTYPRDFLTMNARWLHDHPHDNPLSDLHSPSGLLGPDVYLGEGCQLDAGVQLESCYLFPHVHLGANCRLTHAVVADSCVVPAGTRLDHQIWLKDGVFPLKNIKEA